MYIDMKSLFHHRQYVGGLTYYYFDKKEYKIVEVEKPNSPPPSDTIYYERYIPMFQVDDDKIQRDYVASLNNPKFTKDFEESHIDIAEYLIRNHSYYKAEDWYEFYYQEVCKIAAEWCDNNHIRYK